MAGTKNHDYHILEPDYMPFLGSVSALTLDIDRVRICNGWPTGTDGPPF